MAYKFSWKLAVKRSIGQMKVRRQNYLKHGRNVEADKLNSKIRAREKDIG